MTIEELKTRMDLLKLNVISIPIQGTHIIENRYPKEYYRLKKKYIRYLKLQEILND